MRSREMVWYCQYGRVAFLDEFLEPLFLTWSRLVIVLFPFSLCSLLAPSFHPRCICLIETRHLSHVTVTGL